VSSSLKIQKTISILTILLLTLASSARGSGLLLYETGAPDLGTASAGRAAMAGDASTVAANPAGMTELGRTQLLGAAGALLPFTNFDLAPQTKVPGGGGGGGNAGVFTPIGGFFYAYKLSERLWLGLASDSDFGLSGNYGKPWAGRYYLTYESIITGKVNPNIAYQINDKLSVGAGFSFSVGRLELQSKVNNNLAMLTHHPDGGLGLESWDEAFGGNVGALFKPIENLRVGVTYQSPMDYKFGFRPHLTNLSPLLNFVRRHIGGVKTNVPIEVPQQVMLSGLYNVTPHWTVMSNVDWQNWSAFGQIPIGISARNQRTLNANLHFADTCQAAIGQQLRFGERWVWSAGFAYDSSPVSKKNRIPILPIDRQLRYGTGIQYEINRNVIAGFAWEFMDAGPGPYTASRGRLAGTLQGHYSTNYLNFVGVNVIWKFGSSGS